MEPNCIHTKEGFCPDCQESFDADPDAWWEFGEHPEGIARWESFMAQFDIGLDPSPLMVGDDIPF